MTPPALELVQVSKRFGSVQALEAVSLTVQPGEILALVGENGAGKSTLMNVAYGLYRPDAGEVRIHGTAVSLRSPSDALERGLGMVHQHFLLVPPLSIAENVVLGREPRRRGLLDRAAAERAVREVAEPLGFHLDPAARIETLSVGQQQRVEIVKALFRGSTTLILDEPTAVLTPQEAEELHGIARRLRDQGRTVIFISHKLREVLAVADRVGVMARGKLLDVVNAKDTTAEALAAKMLGDTRGRPPAEASHWGAFDLQARRPAASVGGVVLSLKQGRALDDRAVKALDGVDLELRQGEILGVAGVAGNGQSELAEVLTGWRPLASGELLLDGAPAPESIAERRRLGVVHVPEDRQRRGLCLDLSVAENLSLGRQREAPFALGGRIDPLGRLERARRSIEELDVRPPDPTLAVRGLSGGNQQKVILGRELAGKPRVVIAVQPTRGLDVGAIAQVHERLFAARDAGAAVLLISLDLDELRVLSDRLAVMYAGRVVTQVDPATVTEEQLGRWMLGTGGGASA